jgi:NAD(P)-dependent dehydrogenase (short-subunit alcohol dehydrogenase family)
MNKRILVTGASRGLGYFLAKRYLEKGEMVFAGVRSLSSANLTILKDMYPDTFIPIELEVSDTESVIKASQAVLNYTDRIDVVINNAAIHSDSSFEVLENADIDDCVSVYNINSVGPLRVVKAFLSLIRKSDSAKIINISSESGSIGSCGREKEFDYCMSKAALNMGSKLLSNYLKKDNVLVLAIQPGWMRTDMGGVNAMLDPYENACKLVDLFEQTNDLNSPIFIDNDGKELLW